MSHTEKKESLQVVLNSLLEQGIKHIRLNDITIWFNSYEFHTDTNYTVVHLWRNEFLVASIDLDYITDEQLAYMHKFYI